MRHLATQPVAAVLLLITLVPPAAATPQGDAPAPLTSSVERCGTLHPSAIHHRPLRGDPPDEPIQRWVEAHREVLDGVRPSGLGEQPWGLSGVRPGRDGGPPVMYLYVLDWHAGGNLVVYGLTGGVKRRRTF